MNEPFKQRWTSSQETAINLRGKLLLVSAAAGSGKTSVLTERIIRRLLDETDPISISEILIVTFTRAAASELKSRVAKALGEAFAADPGNSRLSKQLLLLGSAQISTIDAFFQQVVRSNFERLGFPASFRIADRNELYALARETMDALIADFYRTYEPPIPANSEESPFRRLRSNRFADCMDHIFGGTSGSDLGDLLLAFYEKFSSDPQGISLLQTSADALRREADGDFLLSRAGGVIRDRLVAATENFLGVLREVRERHNADPEAGKRQGGILSSDIDQTHALLHALNGTDWEAVRAAGMNFIFAKFITAPERPDWSERYKNARNAFKNLLKGYCEKVFAESPQQIQRQMKETAELAEMLCSFYSAYRERVLSEKLDRGILDFNDVRDSVYRLLTSEDGKSIVEELCGKYREIYIDEYQDVDEIQDRIFSLIGGNRRFMVGDIKQSIYGFRGSDPSIFADYRRSMPLSTDPAASASPSVCVFMSENFRCDQTVIDFANTVCSFLFSACPQSVGYLPEDDLQHGKKDPETDGWHPIPAQVVVFERESAKKTVDADEPAPEADEKAEEKPQISLEARWVASEISKLLREGHLNDGSPILPEHIAILSRNGDRHMEPYAAALRSLGIPVSSESANKLSHSPLLIDLLNLLRAIDNPYRDIPLSEYLTTGFGGFTLDELSEIRLASPTRKSLYDALCAASENADFPVSEKARAFVEWLEGYRRLSMMQPADRFLRLLSLDERFAPISSSPEFLALYEQARVYQRSSWCGLYGFLEYVTRLWDGDQLSAGGFRGADSAVRVMTMHASKGLEFPVVFAVGCGKAFSDQDFDSPVLYDKAVGFSSRLYREEKGGSVESVLREAGKIAISDENAEGEIRLLYVALTRARERLYVTGTSTRLTPSLLNDVSMIRRDSRASILGAKSFLDWILAALFAKEKTDGSYPAVIRWLSPAEPIESLPQSEATVPSTVAKSVSEPLSDRYSTVLERAKTFVYPLDALRGIPTKAAASKLRSDLLDVLKQDDETAIEEQIRLMRDAEPSFEGLLSAHRQPTAAEIGTATHAFLEFCDLPNLTPDGIDAEAERLVSNQFLSPETAKILNRRQLRAFAASPLIGQVRSAARVLREQKFGLFLPLSELTTDPALAEPLKGRELFVQGSIDLVLIGSDGRISLYDYKTDHITPEERADRSLLHSHLLARHGNQLACYAHAIEALFGKRPDKTYLFLLALGEAVEI